MFLITITACTTRQDQGNIDQSVPVVYYQYLMILLSQLLLDIILWVYLKQINNIYMWSCYLAKSKLLSSLMRVVYVDCHFDGYGYSAVQLGSHVTGGDKACGMYVMVVNQVTVSD